MDYNFAELAEIIEKLGITQKTIEDINATRKFVEVVDQRHMGNLSDIINLIRKSFEENEKTIPIQPTWHVEMGLLNDALMENNYLIIFWRVKRPEGGSLNMPYIIQKRSVDQFEIAMSS